MKTRYEHIYFTENSGRKPHSWECNTIKGNIYIGLAQYIEIKNPISEFKTNRYNFLVSSYLKRMNIEISSKTFENIYEFVSQLNKRRR